MLTQHLFAKHVCSVNLTNSITKNVLWQEGLFHDSVFNQRHVISNPKNGYHWVKRQDTVVDYQGDYVESMCMLVHTITSVTHILLT